MSQQMVFALKVNFDRSMDFIKQFIEVCPEEIWLKNFGGWPVWQQIFHTVGCIPFFTDKMAGIQASEDDVKVCKLEVIGKQVKGREELLIMFGYMEKMAGEFFTSLNDAKLLEVCEPFLQKTGKSVTYAGLLSLMASHNMYHLGSCDAALREAGLKGVF